jgi:hypothetical protein
VASNKEGFTVIREAYHCITRVKILLTVATNKEVNIREAYHCIIRVKILQVSWHGIQGHPWVQMCFEKTRTVHRGPPVTLTFATASDAFSVWTQFTVCTGKRSGHPRGMPLVTHLFASSEQAWEPVASPSVNSCRKRAPYHRPFDVCAQRCHHF